MHSDLHPSNSSVRNFSSSKWACWKSQKSYCKAYSICCSFILPIATQCTVESNQVSHQVLPYPVTLLSSFILHTRAFFKRKFSMIFTGTDVGQICLKCTGFCCCLKNVCKTFPICQEHSFSPIIMVGSTLKVTPSLFNESLIHPSPLLVVPCCHLCNYC